MMVLAALGDEWRHVGLGWHPWDLQRGHGDDRVRIQVKQTAAVQLWGEPTSRSLQFGWKPRPPRYFERDSPGDVVESEGWFCELFVFGIHDETDREHVDQVDPAQWRLMVFSTRDLPPRTNAMRLSKVRQRWAPVEWRDLRREVEENLARQGNS